MLNKFLLILCFKVLRKGFSLYCFHNRFASLGSSCYCKGFEFFLICSDKVKLCRHIWVYPNCFALTTLSQKFLLPFQLLHLFFSEVHFVISVSFEWHGIVRELRVFFMIYIFVSILPIWKLRLVGWLSLNRGIISRYWSDFSLRGFHLKALIRSFLNGSCFHWVRINDFVFLFNIKCIFWLHYLCVL